MNKQQRKRIEQLAELLDDIQREIEEIRDEEQDKLDNTPDNLIGSAKYQDMEDAVTDLDAAIDNISDAYHSIISLS